ncbi:MAG: DNA-deoxyinosine glycosylase [Comamonadaceae bacterium]|nr:DNA-deoxyinosine glycosylase [Comamonadaceae bacterium]
MNRLQGLPPVIDAHTRLLVLGSFPGVASLRAQQYYGHPQNHFWKILGALWDLPLPSAPYPERIAALRAHGLGVWDVYQACQREGSLDADIRQGELNDFSVVVRTCPLLEAVAHNGGESHRHARHVAAALNGRLMADLPGVLQGERDPKQVLIHRLPSTSPANASWSFERKRQAWAAVLHRHGIATVGPSVMNP